MPYNVPEQNALEIAEKIVVAQLSINKTEISSEGGKRVGDYFAAIYKSISNMSLAAAGDRQ